jgi:hypothetical protein
MPATWTVGARTELQPGKNDAELLAGFRTPGKGSEPQVVVEGEGSGDGTGQGKAG